MESGEILVKTQKFVFVMKCVIIIIIIIIIIITID
jgi:hypothetical protein